MDAAHDEPVVSIEIRGTTVTVDGFHVEHDGSRSPHEVAVITTAMRMAQPLQRPVRAMAVDDLGRTTMIVHPDASVTEVRSFDYADYPETEPHHPEDVPHHPEDVPHHPETGPHHPEIAPHHLETGPHHPEDDHTPYVGLDPHDGLADPAAGLAPLPPVPPGPLVPASHPGTNGSAPPRSTSAPVEEKVPPSPSAPAHPTPGAGEGETRASRRTTVESRSFLSRQSDVETARSGLRGLLGRLGFRTGPSASELAQRTDVRAVSRHWPGPRTIAVVNAKGGSGKTPTTALLSALFATHGGSGVLAWDNAEIRGTLGWRTEQGPHEAHVFDLLPVADQLLEPTARAADLAAYVHHQTADKYDVLRSNPTMLAQPRRLTALDFDAVHRVASKYFRLIVVDSGDDETGPHWLRMIDHTDQLVVVTTTRPDHAESARLMLDALRVRDEPSRRLADEAVVIVSQADRDEASASSIAVGFNGLARLAVTIPYDRALRSSWLRFDRLHAATQRAYLNAAAEISNGL